READVEKQAFHQAGEYDERLQQRLIRLGRARLEVRIRDGVDERNQELILCTYRRDLVIRVEDLGLIQANTFHDVLVGVRMDRFLESLAQQKLAAFRRSDVAIRSQHDVVGRQRIGRGEETEIALYDAPLVFGQCVGILPLRDIA